MSKRSAYADLLEFMDKNGSDKLDEEKSKEALYHLEYALENTHKGLQAIGSLLAYVGLSCGQMPCMEEEDDHPFPRDDLYNTGHFIQILAEMAGRLTEHINFHRR